MVRKQFYEAPALKSEAIQVGVFGCNYNGGQGGNGYFLQAV